MENMVTESRVRPARRTSLGIGESIEQHWAARSSGDTRAVSPKQLVSCQEQISRVQMERTVQP